MEFLIPFNEKKIDGVNITSFCLQNRVYLFSMLHNGVNTYSQIILFFKFRNIIKHDREWYSCKVNLFLDGITMVVLWVRLLAQGSTLNKEFDNTITKVKDLRNVDTYQPVGSSNIPLIRFSY